jgi:uncharacterized protein YndB with AHSA1/START domain
MSRSPSAPIPADDITAQVSIVVDATPHDIWSVLTDPAMTPKYFMGARIETDWQAGSPVTFHGEWKGTSYEDKGEILAVVPEQTLRFSHWSSMGGTDDVPENYHVVAFDLEDAGDGTNVTLTQGNLLGGVSDSDRESRESYEANWASTLEGLKGLAES